jgi:uncharacterized membrane protein YagU involved in acid resistance
MNATGVLQYVASGVFGKEAFSGGTTMTIAGLIFHYIIALSFTTFYFIVFPYVPFLGKQKLAGGVLYGAFVWSVMNLVIVPLSNTNKSALTWSGASLNIAILIVCIGLPISLLASKYYSSKK